MNTLDQLPFELLPSILEHVQHKDLLTCTLVNKRFHKAALPLLWREVYIKSDKALNLIITILSTSSSTPGQHVRLLYVGQWLSMEDTHLLSIIEHVPYLEKLHLFVVIYFSDASLRQVPRYCPHLTSVDLSWQPSCTDHPVTDASMIALAQHCHQLTHLTLESMHKITDESMRALGQRCHQLTHLTLTSLYDLNYATLLDHFHACPLTHIHIELGRIEPAARQSFVESATLGLHRHHQQTLTSLFINEAGDDIVTTINTHQLIWPRLTSFCVTECDKLTDAMATAFLQAHPQLQKLGMHGSYYLTNQYLDNITRFLPNLRSLNVYWNPQLTASGICRLIRHYNGQLVDNVECEGCGIYIHDDDIPDELDSYGYDEEANKFVDNPSVEWFCVDAFTSRQQ